MALEPPNSASSSDPDLDEETLPSQSQQGAETPASSRPFPTTLADLQPPSNTLTNPSFYSTLKSLRRHTLSIPNRLRSITADSHFVTSVASHYQLPLIANERCGSWYIPPHLRLTDPPGGGSVYFKSTDGHHSQWSFSLRRLNFQLLKVLGEHGGAVAVDSTRRGKSMPDALLKTVPIWVCVINRVLFPEEKWKKSWELIVPEAVGESERAQIEGRVQGWCDGFRGLGLDLEELTREARRPVRVEWAVNGEWDRSDSVERGSEENLLVLCSASRRVRGAEASEGGYIQGAGDDSEGWSRGLTPPVFWKNKDLLMQTSENELPELIEKLLVEEKETEKVEGAVLVSPTKNIYLGAGTRTSDEGFDLVINCSGNSGSSSHRMLDLKCRDGKLGSKDLRDKVDAAKSFAATTLERNPNCRILVACSSGKDLGVGVALVLLCMFFDDSGSLRSLPSSCAINKAFIKMRLAWITSSKPDSNPSRSTLQAVNSFLIDRPS